MRSIQTKITFLVLGCVLMSATVVFGVNFSNIQKTLNQDSEQIMELLCDEKASEINETLRDIEQSVNTMYTFAMEQMEGGVARLYDSEFLAVYAKKIREIASNAVENTEGAIAVYLRFNPELYLSPDGIFMALNQETGQYEDVTPTDILKYEKDDIGHVGWYYMPVEAGHAIWMDSYYNQNLGVEMISYIIPVYSDGTVVGVLGMDIAVDLLRNKTAEVSIYDSGYAFLMDTAGNMVYHPDFPKGLGRAEFDEELGAVYQQILQSQDKSNDSAVNRLFAYRKDGEQKILTFAELVNGMYLVVTVPSSEINVPRRELVKNSLIWIVAALLISAVFIQGLVRSLVQPLRQLTQAARRLANGDMEVSIDCTTKDEVGELAESFRQTAHSLKEKMEYIRGLAYVDVLTGSCNKAAYEEKVMQQEKLIQEQQAEFTVLLMDINNLKRINDTYGHEKGDCMIRDAARIM